jgi:hypothetical protein
VQHPHDAQVAVVVIMVAQHLSLVHGVMIVDTQLLSQELVLKVLTKGSLLAPLKPLSRLQVAVGTRQQLLES